MTAKQIPLSDHLKRIPAKTRPTVMAAIKTVKEAVKNTDAELMTSGEGRTPAVRSLFDSLGYLRKDLYAADFKALYHDVGQFSSSGPRTPCTPWRYRRRPLNGGG